MRGASYTLWKGKTEPSMSSKHAGSIIHAVERKNGAIYASKHAGSIIHAVERKNGVIYVIKTCGEHHTRCGKEKRSHIWHQNMRGASYTLWKGKTKPSMTSNHAGSIIHAVERKNGSIYVIKTCGEHHTRCGKG